MDEDCQDANLLPTLVVRSAPDFARLDCVGLAGVVFTSQLMSMDFLPSRGQAGIDEGSSIGGVMFESGRALILDYANREHSPNGCARERTKRRR
jgi:hypothetical protein